MRFRRTILSFLMKARWLMLLFCRVYCASTTNNLGPWQEHSNSTLTFPKSPISSTHWRTVLRPCDTQRFRCRVFSLSQFFWMIFLLRVKADKIIHWSFWSNCCTKHRMAALWYWSVQTKRSNLHLFCGAFLCLRKKSTTSFSLRSSLALAIFTSLPAQLRCGLRPQPIVMSAPMATVIVEAFSQRLFSFSDGFCASVHRVA